MNFVGSLAAKGVARSGWLGWLCLALSLGGCPASGPVVIPCRSNAQCPTGSGCNRMGVCEQGNAGTSGATLQVTPQTANVMVGGAVQFAALLDDAPASADWSLVGEGSIDSTGLYTAPSAVPGMPVVTVKAVSREVPGAAASALVSVRALLPVPQLSGITPNQAPAGAPDTALTATGSDFVATTELRFDGARLDTRVVSATELQATIPAAQLQAGKLATVVAVTPGLGGTSAGASFMISNPQAALSTITPTSAVTGSMAITLMLTGSGFVPGAVVSANGTTLQSTVVQPTQMTATLTPMLLQRAGALTIAVRNPTPGGGGIGDQIFRVEPAIRTVAGGAIGDTGPAPAAAVSRITYMAFHPVTSELYYSETERHRVMKVDVAGRIRKVAGTLGCTFGGDGAHAVQAGLCSPRGLAFDPLGNLYIADAGNARIRRIDTMGNITTYAGTGGCTYNGEGSALSVSMGELYDIKLGPSGNLYFSSSPTGSCPGGPRVRRLNATTLLTSTIVGNGVNSSTIDDGGVLAATAPIQNPIGIAVDAFENVYIGEHDAHRVKRVNADGGLLITFAGSGTAGNAGEGVSAISGQLYSPRNLAFDDGGLVISAWNGYRLRRVDLATSSMSTLAGTSGGLVVADGLTAMTARIGRPSALAVSASGHVHFSTYSDTNAAPNTIKRIDPAGLVQPVAGPPPQANLAVDSFIFRPYGVAFDGVGGWFLADRETDRIYRVDANGVITPFAGTGVRGFSGDGAAARDAQLAGPEALVFDNGDLYFADALNARVRKIDAQGMISTVAGGGAAPAGCTTTSTVPSAPPSGAGPGYNCFGDDFFASSALLVNPRGLFKSGSTLYISEYDPLGLPLRGSRVRRVNLQTNVITTLAGSTDYRGPTTGFSGDNGPATAAQLNQPVGMALDANGDLVVVDAGNRRLRVVNLVTAPVGHIRTIAGTGASGSSGNGGPASAALFRRPWSLLNDGSGNLYVSDFDAHNVRRIDPQMIITGVAGSPASVIGFSGDGAAARDALLAVPTCLAQAPNGAIYICDSFNERVRVMGP